VIRRLPDRDYSTPRRQTPANNIAADPKRSWITVVASGDLLKRIARLLRSKRHLVSVTAGSDRALQFQQLQFFPQLQALLSFIGQFLPLFLQL
jgi:hypothetical protein